jgi:hypothetical protein
VTPEQIIRAAVEGILAIISLAESLGQRDAVLTALDATLAAARGRTDADLERKHGRR